MAGRAAGVSVFSTDNIFFSFLNICSETPEGDRGTIRANRIVAGRGVGGKGRRRRGIALVSLAREEVDGEGWNCGENAKPRKMPESRVRSRGWEAGFFYSASERSWQPGKTPPHSPHLKVTNPGARLFQD